MYSNFVLINEFKWDGGIPEATYKSKLRWNVIWKTPPLSAKGVYYATTFKSEIAIVSVRPKPSK